MSETAVLIYHMEGPRKAALYSVCKALNIRPIPVPEDAGRVPAGLMMPGLDPVDIMREAQKRLAGSGPAPEIDEEMIVMGGFSEKIFRQFLAALRETSLIIDLKAVMTDENKYWSGAMLQEELKKERAAFQKNSGRKL